MSVFNLYRSESHWNEVKSDLDECVFVKSNLELRLVVSKNLNEDDNTKSAQEKLSVRSQSNGASFSSLP